MYDSVLQSALRLPRQLQEELVAALKAAIFEEMATAGEGEPSRCPRCGHAHVVSKGRDRRGARRWLCRGCGRTFSAGTAGVLALSKLGAETWAAYVEGMVEGLSLRKLAARCGVCLKTSWYMCMRVCSVMDARLAPFRVTANLKTTSWDCGGELGPKSATRYRTPRRSPLHPTPSNLPRSPTLSPARV